ASGKSTFIGALETVLGELARATPPETLMVSKHGHVPSNEIAMMLGARLVSTVEVAEGMRFNEHLVKNLTGGDKVTGKILYKDSFNFRPTAKLWIATNHSPRVDD